MTENCLICLSPISQGRNQWSFSSLLKFVSGRDEGDMNDDDEYVLCSECEGIIDSVTIIGNFNSGLKSKLEDDIKQIVGLILRSEGCVATNAQLAKMRQEFMGLMGGHMLNKGPAGRAKKLTQCLLCLSRFPSSVRREKRSIGSLLNLVRKSEQWDKGSDEIFVLCSECEKLVDSASKLWRSISASEIRLKYVIYDVRGLILGSEDKVEVSEKLAYMREAFMELSGGKLTKEAEDCIVAGRLVSTPVDGNPSNIESQLGNSKNKRNNKRKGVIGTESPRRSKRVKRSLNDDDYVYGSDEEQDPVENQTKRASYENKSKKNSAVHVPDPSNSL